MVKIAIDDLSVHLGDRAVIRDMTARLEPGEFVGIVGPNGAGKSTLVRALLGLIPFAAGEIRIDGSRLGDVSRQGIARKIAYLPQGQTLHWPISVERLVALGRLPHLAPMSRLSAGDREAIEGAMRRADVLGLRGRVATQLSGGEKARVLLARALAVEAPGLVADEPLVSLDPAHQIEVMDRMRREAHRGSMVLAVLHDLTLAARYCDRLLLIDRGRLVAEGAPLDVLTPQRLETVYGIRAHIEAGRDGPIIVPLARLPAAERHAP